MAKMSLDSFWTISVSCRNINESIVIDMSSYVTELLKDCFQRDDGEVNLAHFVDVTCDKTES